MPLTVSQAARELGVSAQTVKKWADSGRLPVERSAVGWRFFDEHQIRQVAQRLKSKT